MDGQLLGGCICICGSTLAIVGMNMQRWSLLRLEAEAAAAEPHEQQALLLNRSDRDDNDDDDDAAADSGGLGGDVDKHESSSPAASPLAATSGGRGGGGSGTFWWSVSLLVYTSGQLVQMAALAFASQTLVSALSNVSLVTNVCVAHCWFGEPFAVCPPAAAPRKRRQARTASWSAGCRRIWRRLMGWDLAAMCILGGGSTVVVLFAPLAPEVQYTIEQLEELFFTPLYFAFFCCSAAAAAATLFWIYCMASATGAAAASLPRATTMALSTGGSEDDSDSVEPDGMGRYQAGAAGTANVHPAGVVGAEAPASVASRRREGLLYAVASAVTGSITITLSKITMLLLRTTLEGASEADDVTAGSWEGGGGEVDQNQLKKPSAWCFITGLVCW
jgi:hypothetical protein